VSAFPQFPKILSGKDTSKQTEDFLETYSSIDGVRIPGARRHNNRKDTGPREVNSALIATITELRDKNS